MKLHREAQHARPSTNMMHGSMRVRKRGNESPRPACNSRALLEHGDVNRTNVAIVNFNEPLLRRRHECGTDCDIMGNRSFAFSSSSRSSGSNISCFVTFFLAPLKVGVRRSKLEQFSWVGEQVVPRRSLKHGSRRRLAACVAIVVLLFATSVGLWHHHDSDSSATCQVCHVAHHQPLVQTQVRTQVVRPVAIRAALPVEAQSSALDPVALHASPRAPPSA